MYVKLFYTFRIRDMEDEINDFLDRIEDDKDIISIDVSIAATRDQTQERDYHHFCGKIAYKGALVET